MKHPTTVARLVRRSAVALTLLAASAAQATAVYGLRDWLDGLGGVYAAQQSTNLWTFHNGSKDGSLFTTNGSSYRGTTSPQQIGMLVDPGELGCTSGFCGGSVPSQTRATFAGTFMHTGTPAATAVVFHADAAMMLDEILLTSEMVQNAHNGDGMEVFVSVFSGGVAQSLGHFAVTYANTTTAALQTVYTPGLTLAAGDAVEVRYGMRGSYLYDHANVDVRITTSAAGGGGGSLAVPEPASLALVGLGLVALVGSRRAGRASTFVALPVLHPRRQKLGKAFGGR